MNNRVKGPITPPSGDQPGVEPERIPGQSQVCDAPFLRVLHENAENRRMQMEMKVPIDMVEWQASGAELVKLRLDFGLQLRTQISAREVAKADPHRATAEFLLAVYQTGNSCWRQGGMAAEQRQMQAHTQLRMFPRQRDGFGIGGFVHHQAGAGQNAFAMRANHCLIDTLGAAKIIGVDDQTPGVFSASHNSAP